MKTHKKQGYTGSADENVAGSFSSLTLYSPRSTGSGCISSLLLAASKDVTAANNKKWLYFSRRIEEWMK